MKYQYYLSEPGFTVKNIDIQNVSRAKGYKHLFRDGRAKHGFAYVVSGGVCDTFQNGESISVTAGELMFIPKGSVYCCTYLEENTKTRIVQFDLASGELPEYLSKPMKVELPNGCQLVDTFFDPVENRVSNHPLYYLSHLYNLLWQIDESYLKIPTKYKKLQGALSEMTEYWNENHSVAYYADLCGMSEVNFRRLFREYMGVSPIEYRNDIRLTNAKNKLRGGEYNVSEVAELCGFSNLSFFIRSYKKKYGHTPKKE